MTALTVRAWTEREFTQGREAWHALLAASRADPLFMSWDWQHSWWEIHRPHVGGELLLLAVEDASGQLVGLAPLYRRPAGTLRILRTPRLECLGTVWRDGLTAFTEYYDFIARRDSEAEVLAALGDALRGRRDWADWIVSVVRPGSLVDQATDALASSMLRRPVETLPARVIPLAGSYAEFLRTLSSGARRRMHHQRVRLASPSVRLASRETIDAMLAQMDQWRASRWGANAGASLVGRFERMLAQRLAPHGTLRLSEFSENGRPLSVMLNVRMAGTEYYLASAFDPARGSGLSPGYLHFGYAIEAACADGVARFDLLAGRGRHRDYKVDFGPREEPLVSWQLVRAPVLRGLYGLHGFVRRADP